MHNSMVSIAPVEELQTNPSVNCTGYLVLHLDLKYISSFNFTKHEQKVQPGRKTKGCPTADGARKLFHEQVGLFQIQEILSLSWWELQSLLATKVESNLVGPWVVYV